MHGRDDLHKDLAWLRAFTPATRGAARDLPSLSGERLLVVCHLDVKTIPYFEALVEKGADVWAHAANPATTRDAVSDHLGSMGVHTRAQKDDQPERHAAHLESAVAAGPTLLSEMGADATVATEGRLPSVRGGIEATGTGIKRLAVLDLRYPADQGRQCLARKHGRIVRGIHAYCAS